MTGRFSAIVGLLGLCGVLALGGAVATGASFTDLANANVGGGPQAGFGSRDRFDIALVDGSGRVRQASSAPGASWAIPGADTLVPGRSVTTEVLVFNNSPRLPADLAVSVVARNGDGRVSATVPNITPYLRFTAKLPDGTVLFEDAALAEARGALPTLERRGRAAQTEPSYYTAATTDSSRRITLTIEYLDEPGVELLNGGQSAVGLRFDATSRSGL